MALLLAVSVIILACTLLYTLIKNNELHHRVEGYKTLHAGALREARSWETKSHNHRLSLINAEGEAQHLKRVEKQYEELYSLFEHRVREQVLAEKENLTNQMNLKLAPESHDIQQTDVEGLILSSPDPLWQFISEHRDLVRMWEQRRLDIVNTQPHYRYSEFATWLANFCEGHFNYDDVKRAIEAMEVVR